MNHLRNWSLGFLGTAGAVIVCYFWLDRPIAQFVHDELHGLHLFEKLTLIPDALTPFAVVAFMVLGLRGLTGQKLSRFQTVVLLSGVSLKRFPADLNRWDSQGLIDERVFVH